MHDHAWDATAAAAEVAACLGHAPALPLLRQAFTHTSSTDPRQEPVVRRASANERLEFLGDALLGAAVCDLLFHRHGELDEGRLSRMKSNAVSRATLAAAIDASGLLRHARVGSQMGAGPAAWPESVRANLCEALLGAIYLDGGWAALRTAVARLLDAALADPGLAASDPRMRLQSWCLEHHRQLPVYTHARLGGTDHNPEFTATARIGETHAAGSGSSRRRAEAAAAEALLSRLVPQVGPG